MSKRAAWGRRFFFLFWMLVAAYLHSGVFLLPACLLNLLQPRPAKWKRILLLIGYAPFPILMAIHLINYSSYYYLVFAALYFLPMVWRGPRTVVFATTLGLLAWLWLASAGNALGGPLLVAALTLTLLAVWIAAAVKNVFPALFQPPEDIFVHFFIFSLVHLTWFFFMPAPYPGAWLAEQRGFERLADSSSNAAYRKVGFLSQMGLAAEWPDGSLVLTTKRSTVDSRPDYRLFFFDQQTGALREETSDRVITTEQLVECPPGRPITQTNIPRESIISLFGKPDQPAWRGAEKSGYCLTESRLLMLSDERQLRFTDSETGEEVYRHEEKDAFPNDAVRFFAPYGPGKLAAVLNERLNLIEYDRATRKFKWKVNKSFIHRMEGESRLLGDESYPYVFLVNAAGRVEKIDAEAGAIIARGAILPGFRFVAFEPRLRLLYVVNDLLGILEVLDGEDLRRLDRIYVGHAARRFNPAREARGVGYIVSSAGMFRLDICERLPDKCREWPATE